VKHVDRSELAALVAKAVANAPVLPTADPGLALSFAMLRVLARRHGPSFLEEVRSEMKAEQIEWMRVGTLTIALKLERYDQSWMADPSRMPFGRIEAELSAVFSSRSFP
jgi:hypothetical protein